MMLLIQVSAVFALPVVFSFVVVFGRFIELPKVNHVETLEEADIPKVRNLRKITAELLKQPRRITYNPAYTKAGYVPRV